MGVLGSTVKAWHCAAAELLGRLVINPDNEPFLLPFAPQVRIITSYMLRLYFGLNWHFDTDFSSCRSISD